MRTSSLLRFNEASAAVRPIDEVGGIGLIDQVPIEFGSAAALRNAIGWGKWNAAWHCNELAGNLLAAFGAPNLTPASSPIYGLRGPRSGADRSVGFDSGSDAFTGGDNFDVNGTADLIIGIAFKAQTGAANAGVIQKWNGSVGWWFFQSAAGAINAYVSDGVNTTNFSATAPVAGEWQAGLLYIDRTAGKVGIALKSLTTGTVISSSGNIGSVGNCENASNVSIGNDGVFGGTDCPDISFVAIGAGSGAASGVHANIATAIANFGAALLSGPSVVDAAAGRGRSFVALSGHGFEGADITPGSTLSTRDASVQALIRWDLADQGAAMEWTLTKTGGAAAVDDAGAASVETITGDGYLEFTATQGANSRCIGLSTSISNGFAQIDYMLAIDDVTFNVFESGVQKTISPAYASGDVFRVQRIGSTITYLKNGITIYTSLAPSSGLLLIDSRFFVVNSSLLGVRMVDAGARKAITWGSLVNVTATPTENIAGTIYARGKASSAAEYQSAGVELAVINASAGVGELRWLWQTQAGVLKRQVGAPITVPASGYLLVTATRHWVSTTKVILRYYVGGTMIGEVESVDGDIGGGTTGTTSIGARFNGTAWADFFDGVIDELRVLDYELAPEEVEATWLRISRDQPQGYQLVRELHPPGFPISDDPSSRVQRETNLWGQALGFAAAQGENVRENVLPDRAYGDTLTRWEAIVGARPGPNDTIDQRRARVLGRLRARAGASIPGVRDALADLVATDTDNVEILGFRQEIVDSYRELELWSFDSFRAADLGRWMPVTGNWKNTTTIQKTTGVNAYDAGASSVETFAGDIYVEVTCCLSSSDAIFGLTDAANPSPGYADIDYGISIEVTGSALRVVELGVVVFSTTWVPGSRIQVKRVGTTISYNKEGGAAFYTSLTPSSAALRVHTSIAAPGAELFRLYVSTGITLTWQNAVGVLFVTNPTNHNLLGGATYRYEGSTAKEWATADLSISSSHQYKAVIDGYTVPLEGFGAHFASRVDMARIPANSEAGIAFHDNARNTSLLLGFRCNGAGTYEIITERFVDGVSLGAIVRSATTLRPHWLKLYSVAPVPAAYVAPSSSAWDMIAAWSTTGPTAGFTEYAFTHTPRFQWASLYMRSLTAAALTNTIDGDFGDTRLWTPYGDRSLYFYAYRPLALPGTADTEAAHFALQGLKQAHTVGTIITSKALLYDTAGHGYDRGPLGGL